MVLLLGVYVHLGAVESAMVSGGHEARQIVYRLVSGANQQVRELGLLFRLHREDIHQGSSRFCPSRSSPLRPPVSSLPLKPANATTVPCIRNLLPRPCCRCLYRPRSTGTGSAAGND